MSQINIPSSVVSIQNYAFAGCSSLSQIDIPSSVTSIADGLFANCTNLSQVGIPNGVTRIGSSTFYRCQSLTDLKIPSSVASISSNPFEGCSNLKNVEFASIESLCGIDFWNENSNPLNITRKLIVNGTEVTDLVIPNSVTSIGKYAFYGCDNLDNVTIPSSVTSIGSDAFYGYNGLIYFSSVSPSAYSWIGCGSNAMLIVPDASYSSYLAQWSDYASQITPTSLHSVDVTLTANTSMSALHKMVGDDNLEYIVDLKISGSINSYDFMILNNKMPRLRKLDLSGCKVKGCEYEHRQGYHTDDDIFPMYAFFNQTNKLMKLALPQVDSIASYALYGCSRLSELTFADITTGIGDNAFYGCSSLKSLIMPASLQKIGSDAFSRCYSLQEVTMPATMQSIGRYAFQDCRLLTSFVIPDGVSSIEYGTFYGASSLKDLRIPSSVSAIYSYASEYNYGSEKPFYGTQLTSIAIPEACTELQPGAMSVGGSLIEANLPKTLKRIGDYAFQYDQNLSMLKIPSSVAYIGHQAFRDCRNLDTIYVYTIEPTAINQETFATEVYDNAILMVPKTSYYNYYYDTKWSQFRNLKEFEAPYDYFYVSKDYELDNGNRVLGTPDITVNPGGSLVVSGADDQNADDIEILVDGNVSGSVIAESNINATSATIIINVEANRWYYFSFPFDIDRADVKVPGSHAFYAYDGAVRAQNGNGGWKKVTKDMVTLHKGTGYIFQCNLSGELKLKVKTPDFTGDDISISLASYISNNVDDASWNFVGNPYPSYYPVHDMDYTAPVTVWNFENHTYEAISPVDDDYILHPFQGFFVQKPTGTNVLKFSSNKRLTYLQAYGQPESAAAPMRRAHQMSTAKRVVLNLFVSDGENSDRTRVVLNDEAQMEYELDCDAAKFISSEAAIQLYSLHKGVKYAINERPQNNSEVELGYQAVRDGNYTIHTTSADVCLYDKVTGIKTRLDSKGYSFSTKAGSYNDRFVLIYEGVASGINSIAADEDAEGIYYDASGIAVGSCKENLPAGTYIRKANGQSEKVIVM